MYQFAQKCPENFYKIWREVFLFNLLGNISFTIHVKWRILCWHSLMFLFCRTNSKKKKCKFSMNLFCDYFCFSSFFSITALKKAVDFWMVSIFIDVNELFFIWIQSNDLSNHCQCNLFSMNTLVSSYKFIKEIFHSSQNIWYLT